MKFFSRRDFLRTTTAGVVGLALAGAKAEAQLPEEKGFSLSAPNFGPVSFSKDIADSYMTAARDNFGANSVAFPARSDFDGQRVFDKAHDPFQEERMIVYIEKAQSLGLKPYLWNAVVPGFKNSDGEHSVEVTPANLQNFLDGVGDQALRFAKLADTKNVPQYSPFHELSLHTSDANRVNAWIKELVPQLRQAYGGELSPNLLRPEVETNFDFSGFDSIGIQANVELGSGSEPSGHRAFVRSQIDAANAIAAKNGLGKATISELGVPIGIKGVTTRAQQKALMEAAFAGSEGLARGRYVVGFGDAIDYEFSVVGKPAGEVVRREFGGPGPNSYEDKKPAVLKTVLEAQVYRAGPKGWSYPTISMELHMNDVSGPKDIEGFRIMGKGGGDPNSKLLVDGTLPLLRVQKWRVGDGGNVPFEIYPEGKVRISDKHGHRDERVVVPKDRMPAVAPEYRGNVSGDLVTVPIGGKLEYRLPTQDQDGTPLSWENAFIRLLDNNWQPLKKITMGLSDTSLSLSKLIPNARKGMTYNVQVVVGGGKPNESLMPDGSTFVKWIHEVGAGARLKVV